MSPSLDGIEVGKCYLTDGNTVRRVVTIHPDGRVQYEWRAGYRKTWKVGILPRREFTVAVEREVACDWTPDGA
jgi:hypothetical protein